MSNQETTVFVRFEHNLAQFRQSVASQLGGLTSEMEGLSGRLGSVQIGENLVASFRSSVNELRNYIRTAAGEIGAEYRTAIQRATSGPLELPGGQKLGTALAGLGRTGVTEFEQLFAMFNRPELRQFFPNFEAEGKAAFQSLIGDVERFDVALRQLARDEAQVARGAGALANGRPLSVRDVYGSNAATGRIQPAANAALERTGLTDIVVPTSQAEVQAALRAYGEQTRRATQATERVAVAEERMLPSLEQATALANLRVDGWRRVNTGVNSPFARTDPTTGQTSYFDIVNKKANVDALLGDEPSRVLQRVTEPDIIQQRQAQERLAASTLKGQRAEDEDAETTKRLTAARSRFISVLERSASKEPGVGPIGGGFFRDGDQLLQQFKTPFGTGLNQLDPISAEYLAAQKRQQENILRRGNPLAEGPLGANQAEPLSFQRLTTSFAGGLFGRGFNPNAQFNIAEALPNVISTAGVLTRYGALSAAIYGVTKALADTKREALDYVDSLTDISVALDTSRTKADAIVPSLEVFSRLAGTNVGGSLDAAARGIRAFGEVGSDSTQKLAGIGVETAKISNQIAVIAHKDLKDATGDVIAVASAYGITADRLSEVSDAIANAKNNLGGDPGQISQGLANFAQVAHQSGIGLQAAANLISVIQAKTDQSGQAVATRLSRIVDVMQGAGAQGILKGLGVDTQADVLNQFSQLKAKLSTLSPDQGKAVEARLAGTANLREFTVALQESDRILEATGGSFAKVGAGQAQFDRLNRDLSATLRHLSGDISNIQVNIARSGLLDIFGLALREAESLLHTVSDVTEGFVSLTHVIPNIGPLPLRSLVIMAAEVVLGFKAWQSVSTVLASAQARVTETTGLLTSALNNLAGVTATETAEEVANAEAKDLVTKATVAESEVRSANAAVIDAESAALAANTAERLTNGGAGAVGAAGAAGGIAKGGEEAATAGLLANARGRATSLFSGVLGKVLIGVAIAQVADGIYNGFKGFTDKAAAADKTSAGAYSALSGARSANDFTTAAQQLKEAAQQQAHASSGFFGTVGNLLESNVHTHSSQDAAAAAKQASDWAKALTDEQKSAAQGQQAGVFQDLSSVDGVKQGLDALSASGASAATAFKLLTTALDAATAAAASGPLTILPGQTQTFEINATKKAFDALAPSLAATFKTTKLDPTRDADLTANGFGVEAFRKEHDLSKDEFKKPNNLADFYVQQVYNNDNLPDLQKKTKSTIDEFLKAANVDSGGELSTQQVDDLVNNKIFPIWQKDLEPYIDPKFRDQWKKNFHDKLAALISGKGDLGSLIVDQGTSAFIQQTLIAQAQQKAQDSGLGNSTAYQELLSSRAAVSKRIETSEFSPKPGVFQDFLRKRQQVAQGLANKEDPVAIARQKLADIEKAEAVALQKGTGITDATAQAHLQALFELNSALETRAESVARYTLSLISQDDITARDQANVAELTRQAAFYAKPGPNQDLNKARDLQAQVNDARQQKAKDEAARQAALITDFGDPSNSLDQAQRQLQADTVLLNSITQYGKNGQLTKAWADAYAKVQQDKQSLSQIELQAALAANLAAVDPRDTLGQLHAQLQNALATAASTSGADHSNAVAQSKSIQNQINEYYNSVAKAQIEASVFPGSSISSAAAKVKEAQLDLAAAGPDQAKWWQAYGALQQAQYDLGQAELDYAHQVRLSHIDITNPLQVAREAVKTAKAKLARDQAAGATPDVIQADTNDVTSAQLAAQKTAFDQRLHDVQTAEQLGTLSHSAYVAWLQHQDHHLREQIAGMKKTDAGYRQAVEELQQVDLALKSANEQFSGLFNIGDIKVPTPYEVRRAIKTHADQNSANYDARGVAVGSIPNRLQAESQQVTNHNNVHINGADLRQVKAYLLQLLGPSAVGRTGTTTTKV